MTTVSPAAPQTRKLTRHLDATPERVWEICSTARGLEHWWVPDGFSTRVRELDLRAGGQVRYALTAEAPETVAFITDLGLPLTTEFVRRFTDVEPGRRLAFLSCIDFVPGVAPYDHLTVLELAPAGAPLGAGTELTLTLDPLHDLTWNEEYVAHREGELDALAAHLHTA